MSDPLSHCTVLSRFWMTCIVLLLLANAQCHYECQKSTKHTFSITEIRQRNLFYMNEVCHTSAWLLHLLVESDKEKWLRSLSSSGCLMSLDYLFLSCCSHSFNPSFKITPCFPFFHQWNCEFLQPWMVCKSMVLMVIVGQVMSRYWWVGT